MIDTAEPAQAASTSLGFPPTTIAVFIGLAIMALALDLAAHDRLPADFRGGRYRAAGTGAVG